MQADAADGQLAAKNNRILRSLLYGQYGNLFKFALWWTSLAPLTIALLGTSTAVGAGRIVYNSALSIFAPLGPIICTRLGPKKVLLSGVALRFVVWCLALPALWTVLFEYGNGAETWVYVGFCVALFFDGVAVAITSFLDIDFCGVDAVAGAYGIDVDDDSRNYFNSRNELFFSACFIVFSPLMSWGTLLYKAKVKELIGSREVAHLSSSATLGSVFTATFLIGSAVQLYFFSRFPRPQTPEDRELPLNSGEDEKRDDDDGNQQPLTAEASGAVAQLCAGLRILCANPPVFFRIVFLALEISVEDSVIVVIASHCGLMLAWQGDGDAVSGNIWTSMGVSCGKMGALAASFVMMHVYRPPPRLSGYWNLFLFVCVAAALSTGIPVAVRLYDDGYIGAMAARGVYFLSLFLFFFFSTLPKIGFQSLLQSMVAAIPDGHLVFGLIAIFFTVIDSGMIMGLTLVFQSFSMEESLWIATSFFMLHGVVELIIGPCLVLQEPKGDVSDNADRESVSTSTSLATVRRPDPTSLLRDDD